MTIPLSQNQLRVFEEVRTVTRDRTVPWIGVLCPRKVSGSTRRAAIMKLEQLGVIRVTSAKHHRRCYELLRRDVKLADLGEVCRARFAGISMTNEKAHYRDSGRFGDAFRMAFPNLEYDRLKVKPDVPFRGAFRADARAL